MYNKYIQEIFESKYNFYAHTSKSSSKELLYTHCELTLEYYNKMEEYKNLKQIIFNIIKEIYPKSTQDVQIKAYELFKSAIYYHDIGKINPLFQKLKMDNDINIRTNSNSEHSIYSSNIFTDAFMQELFEKKNKYQDLERAFLMFLILCYAYIISVHHTKLNNIDKFISDMFSIDLYNLYKSKINKNKIETFMSGDFIQDLFENIEGNKESLYLLLKLLYSTMITADYYATYEYQNKNKVIFDREKKEDLFTKYKQGQLYNNIQDYKDNKKNLEGIDKLRSDMYIETEMKILNNMDKKIFYLEAPTGAGKTNMAINLARILYENCKEITNINYIFPFNTIIEQTGTVFRDYFQEYDDFVIINSITSMVSKDEMEIDYDKEYIRNVFSHYPIKITSHINLFNTLFGVEKSSNFALYNYINSIIVLDEIQSYSNKKWRDIVAMLDKYAELFNIRFIIMSATLPRIDSLIDNDKSKYVELIDDSDKYYQNTLFKNRVSIDFSLLEKDINLEILRQKVLEYKGRKILVEFINKQTARDFYNLLKSDFEFIYEITGDDNNHNRKKIINEIKIRTDIIVIATQTIEAGVDIDMDVGFKDISLLDSEEQFLGRINRSSKKRNCIAYFFDLDNAQRIYKDDYRLQYSLKDIEYGESMKAILQNKKFSNFYTKVMEKLYNETSKYNKNNFNNLMMNCMFLNFALVEEQLKLIENKTVQVFLNIDINVEGFCLRGKEVWNRYKEICLSNSIPYTKKQIELSKLREQFNYFIYNVFVDKTGNVQFSNDNIGNIYYIENGNDYIENDKFNRKKYMQQSGGLII